MVKTDWPRKIFATWVCQVNCADDTCSGFTQPRISYFLVSQSFLMTLTMSWAKSPKNLSHSEGVTHRWTPAWLLPTRTSYKSTLAPIYLFHCYSSFSSSPHFDTSGSMLCTSFGSQDIAIRMGSQCVFLWGTVREEWKNWVLLDMYRLFYFCNLLL